MWRTGVSVSTLDVMATPQQSTALPKFSGEYRHALDDKNRVIIPASWRHGESAVFFVIPNPTKSCLTAMPPAVFDSVAEKMAAQEKIPPEKLRLFIDHFHARAQILNADKQGRMLIPEDFRAKIGLKNESMLSGGDNRFDIWNPTAWESEKEKVEATFAEVWRSGGV